MWGVRPVFDQRHDTAARALRDAAPGSLLSSAVLPGSLCVIGVVQYNLDLYQIVLAI
jgi:hypothetical protein